MATVGEVRAARRAPFIKRLKKLKREAEALLASAGRENNDLVASLALVLRTAKLSARKPDWADAVRVLMDPEANRKHRRGAPQLLALVRFFYPNLTASDHYRYTGFVAYAYFKKWKSSDLVSKFSNDGLTLAEAGSKGRKLALAKGWPKLGLDL